MDFLNKSFAQLKDLFLSMTPAARITSALLLAVVVISLGYLFTHEIAGPEVYLLGGEMFSSSEINNMATAFSQEGLDSYEIEGNKIRVPRNRRGEYMAALGKHNALPEDFTEIFTSALKAGGAFISPSDRQAYLKSATQESLSRMLSDWPGIERAYVLYGTKRKGGWSRDTVATASVQIKPRNNEPLDPAVISSIRQLVRGAIPGLKPEDCAVTDLSTQRTTVGGSEGYGSPLENAYIATKQYYEREYKDKILEGLSWIPGVTVTPYVELKEEMNHREEQVQYDPKGSVPVSLSETSVERTSESAAPAGRPGYMAQNAARTLATATAKGTSETETQSESTQQSLTSTTRTTSEKPGLTPERVTVAVTVPTSYFERVWRKENPPKEGEEAKQPEASDLEPIRTQTIARVKEFVATTIPQPADGTDPKDLVTVAPFPDIAPPDIPEPGLAANVFVWLGDYWSTLGLIGLALASLLMLRSMIRAAPVVSTEARAPAAASGEPGEEEELSAQEVADRKLKRFSGSRGSLRDELSELVNEDPDIAANILRNWIGTAT
ncbi:MAG TPA: flagellar M-ring protein FliF C-terminal domain-containing protein [Thermoguttaceae bacterium]|nr:flagellar M-ring protein FliF C-terminal domain-containing protein [Thermoguttaceae bacterium]